MKNKSIIAVLLCACICVTGFAACSKSEPASNTTTTTTKATTSASTTEATTATTQTTTASTTKNDDTTKAQTTKKGQTTKKQSTTAKQENKIVLKKNGAATTNVKSGVSISKSLVKITQQGSYIITSDTDDWHGQIVISLPNTAKCDVRFENVNISYNKGNIIQIIDSSIKSKRSFLEPEASNTDANDDAIKEVADNDKAPNVDLSFPTGTSSTFSSSANSYTGIIYNESKLTLKGNGKLNLASTRNGENCLCTTKSVTFKNLTTKMTTAANTSTEKLSTTAGSAKGIFSYNKVNVESGKLTIQTNGDGVRCDKFYNMGGTVVIKSSACDAIDADDVIELAGGSTACYALEKSAFKVRRVNSSEIRKDEAGKPKDYFKITKGTAVGESKKMTAPTASTQPSILAKIKKKASSAPAGGTSDPISSDDSDRLQIITIKNADGSKLRVSSNKCTKLLYSAPAIKNATMYTAVSDSGTYESTKWVNGVCQIKVRSTK